ICAPAQPLRSRHRCAEWGVPFFANTHRSPRIAARSPLLRSRRGLRAYLGIQPTVQFYPRSYCRPGIRCATRPAQSPTMQWSPTAELPRQLPYVPAPVPSKPMCRALRSLEGLPVDRINLSHLGQSRIELIGLRVRPCADEVVKIRVP